MRLSAFISANKEPLLQAWEDFARTVVPPALTMDVGALRNDVEHILDWVAEDLNTPQTKEEQVAKSQGQAKRGEGTTYPEKHAIERLKSGFSIGQLVSEYRALRASVLKLWLAASPAGVPLNAEDITRLNEAIDQAVFESVAQFSQTTSDNEEREKRRLDASLQALRESEAKFRVITDAMPQMVWSALPNGSHDYYNRQWYEFTGLPMASDAPAKWHGTLHPDDHPHASERWKNSLETGEPYEIFYRLRHRSGEYRWVLGRALPLLDESGQLVRWMGTCTDVHDQKLAEEALKDVNRRKDEFLAMLAHELRNPLAPISAVASLLKAASNDVEVIQACSDILSRQVKHMTGLIDDLLDVSRVTRGLVQLETSDVNMKLVVSDAIEQARPFIEERNHHVDIHTVPTPVYVHGDKTRLVQIVVNILNNAARYSPSGSEISVHLSVQDNEVVICITDNGDGIDPALLPHIFDLFTQGHQTSARQGGLGLGLALVKNLTTLHGGSVTVHSNEPATGTTFKVFLPLLHQKYIKEAVTTPRPALSSASRPLTLMIVDDNRDAAQTLATMLEMLNHRVMVKSDAASALQAIDNEAPQAFILDIGLPDMDGYELARQLRANPRTEKALLIAVTGYGQEQDRMMTTAAGFDHHLVKPVTIQHLLEAISEGMSRPER